MGIKPFVDSVEIKETEEAKELSPLVQLSRKYKSNKEELTKKRSRACAWVSKWLFLRGSIGKISIREINKLGIPAEIYSEVLGELHSLKNYSIDYELGSTLRVPKGVRYLQGDGLEFASKCEGLLLPASLEYFGSSDEPYPVLFDDIYKIRFPKGCEYISDNVRFPLVTHFEAVGVKSLPRDIFEDNDRIATCILGNGCLVLPYIDSYAIKSFTVPDSITELTPDSFGDMPCLETLNLGKGVLKIDTFHDFSALKELIIPKDSKLQELDFSGFSNSKLKTVWLPPTVKELSLLTFPMDCNIHLSHKTEIEKPERFKGRLKYYD